MIEPLPKSNTVHVSTISELIDAENDRPTIRAEISLENRHTHSRDRWESARAGVTRPQRTTLTVQLRRGT